MALRLMSSDDYSYPVKVSIFDKGKWNTTKINARFRALPKSRVDEILSDLDEETADEALLQEVVTGWDEFPDLDGSMVAFNEENKAAVFDAPQYSRAFLKSFFESLSGPRNRRKNS